MLVATKIQLDAQGRDGSLMQLFRYISGASVDNQKIAMTTPVFMERKTESTSVQMGFVMPQQVASAGIPAPTGEKVEVRRRTSGRFAVVRFSGQLNSQKAKDFEAKLRAWMETKGLIADDSSEDSVATAGYDPPFTPGSFRRNEVLIRLKQ